jgi:hypothetical protein
LACCIQHQIREVLDVTLLSTDGAAASSEQHKPSRKLRVDVNGATHHALLEKNMQLFGPNYRSYRVANGTVSEHAIEHCFYHGESVTTLSFTPDY